MRLLSYERFILNAFYCVSYDKYSYQNCCMQNENEAMKDSFLEVPTKSSTCFRILKQVDIFSFVPFPKNEPVSTCQSLCGSLLFLVIILAFILVDFLSFVSENPPNIQNYYTKLDYQNYTLPKVAIAFMEGQFLNETRNYDDVLTFAASKEIKMKNDEGKFPIPLDLNNKTYLNWMSEETQSFYSQLQSPSEDMVARGLLYSTDKTNYTKISVKMCNVDDPLANCDSLENITSLMAKGRIFLFIEQEEDESQLGDMENYGSNRYTLHNFFLIPFMYKRISVNFEVVKTEVLPDYFWRFTPETYQRLQVGSILEQTSNTTINDLEKNRTSLQMLGITFQLSGEIQHVRASYETILDRVSKWGAFSNLIFTILCIFFLSFNRKKFYERHPEWEKFNKYQNLNPSSVSSYSKED